MIRNTQMKSRTAVSAWLVGLTAVVTLFGAGAARAQSAGSLGTPQQAGPFQVTLIASPQVGTTRFETRVSRDGRGVSDAKVTLSLSMPNHRHGSTVERLQRPSLNAAQVDLEAFAAQYVGSARLMEGTYEARVIVKSGRDKGIASYRFTARRTPYVAHIGMWHPAGGFEVRFLTEPNPPVSGDNRLLVQVTREGYPVTDAQVSVALTMPTMARMGGENVFTTLTASNGRFEGIAKLHPAEWRARITVKTGSATGSATYDFPVR
jgi:hypothetical protein